MNTSLASVPPRNACTALDHPEATESTQRAQQSKNTERTERTQAPKFEAPRLVPSFAKRVGDSLSRQADALQQAAKKLLDPQGRCEGSLSDAEKTIQADFKAFGPKLDVLATHLKEAAPALKQLGLDGYKFAKGVSDCAKGAEELQLAALELIGTEGAAAPAAVLQAIHAAYTFTGGLKEAIEGASKLPGDWKIAKPHLEQLMRDVDAMMPELNKLKYDAEKAAGTVRHECIRM